MTRSFSTPHPNRREFTGILTVLDIPSDESPSGSRGKRVIMSRQCAEDGIESLIGMGINFGESKHAPRLKCGVITKAIVVDDSIMIAGHLYELDFPEVIRKIEAAEEDYGMSY